MKYVCELCGQMLRVDRDLDDDRFFERAVRRHVAVECPKQFAEERIWVAPSEPAAAPRI